MFLFIIAHAEGGGGGRGRGGGATALSRAFRRIFRGGGGRPPFRWRYNPADFRDNEIIRGRPAPRGNIFQRIGRAIRRGARRVGNFFRR